MRSLVAFVFIGILVHVLVGRQVEARYQEFAEFHAEFLARSVIQHQLEEDEVLAGPISQGTLAELIDFVERYVIVGDVLRLKVWLPDGTIVLSEDESLIGQRSPGSAPHLRAVLRGGTETEREHAASGADVGAVPDSIETYVPIWLGQRPAIVEVYQDLGPTLRAADDFTRTLDLILVVGLAGLWVLLIPIARRAADRLAHQNVELERLLSQEKEAVARLAELNDMKDTFLSAVSHELRTPLTVLKAGSQTLKRRAGSLAPSMREAIIDRIAANADRLDDLLSSLLDVDRLVRGTVVPVPEPTDLRTLVERVLGVVRSSRSVTCDVPRIDVDVDAAQVERVVENLLTNALRHTPDDAPVHVGAEVYEDEVVLRVDDAGPGVPDDQKQRIFEPFAQGPALHPESPGTGVGLTLVARFAQLNGGRAWVEDRPSGGASFRVAFPRSRSADTSEAPAAEAGTADHASRVPSGSSR